MPIVRGTSNCKTGAGKQGTKSFSMRERPHIQKRCQTKSGRQRGYGTHAGMGKKNRRTYKKRDIQELKRLSINIYVILTIIW